MLGNPENYKEMVATKFTLENEEKATNYLFTMNDMLRAANEYLSRFSINRYLDTPLTEVDLSTVTFQDWFDKESLFINENKLNMLYRDDIITDVYTSFLSDLTDKKLEDSSRVDSHCIEVLGFLFFYEHDGFFNRAYNKRFKEVGHSFDFMDKQADYTVSKLMLSNESMEMPIGDQTKLSDFINILRVLNAKVFISKNLETLNNFGLEVYNIGEFNYRFFEVPQ